MLKTKRQDIAVIGTGIAGAACAHALSMAGHAVQVFDKSRGPGGRLATRRIEWVDSQGQACMTPLDHGSVAITARTATFQAFVDHALQAGWLAEWVPRLAAQSLPLEGDAPLYLPVPGMSALCRHLLDGVAAALLQPAREAPARSVVRRQAEGGHGVVQRLGRAGVNTSTARSRP
jgi:renalase